tara:strand:- start:1265 stop:1420 length:156 start_codon:yes stop_codon:yes gene_type:complete
LKIAVLSQFLGVFALNPIELHKRSEVQRVDFSRQMIKIRLSGAKIRGAAVT